MRTRYIFGGAVTATAVVLGIGIYGMLDGYVETQLASVSQPLSGELATPAESASREREIDRLFTDRRREVAEGIGRGHGPADQKAQVSIGGCAEGETTRADTAPRRCVEG